MIEWSEMEALVQRANRGDRAARAELLERHRQFLLRIVALRMDRRLAPRVDASDIVQETMARAARDLSDYLRRPGVPFSVWLRQIASERLADVHRLHIRSQRRSVTREEPGGIPLPDESVIELAQRLLAGGSSPSRRMIRDEERKRLRAALASLPERDREILVMRHLEQLENSEIAAVLSISEGAVRVRHVRALRRLRALLDEEHSET
jgi:RNA polymerase sigma-70 factor (ECF subfamily)